MNELIASNEEYEEEKMGSWNHSITQSRVASQLSNDERFVVPIELSLDISQIDLSQFGLKASGELKPDVCLYPSSKSGIKSRDILKMSEMPLLAIEIISPKQGIDDILAKFEGYFALGIKSCWLITPNYRSIAVHSRIDEFKLFDTKHDIEVSDEVLDIRLPLKKIFE